jgi:hypothetical protein
MPKNQNPKSKSSSSNSGTKNQKSSNSNSQPKPSSSSKPTPKSQGSQPQKVSKSSNKTGNYKPDSHYTKSWGSHHNFMLSYGIKPYETNGYEQAKAIINEFRKADGHSTKKSSKK